MDNFRGDCEESHFFDALDHIAQEPDFVSDCSNTRIWDYDVWISPPQSVTERRKKFIKWMGLSSGIGVNALDTLNSSKGSPHQEDINRILETSGAVLRTLSMGDEFPSRSSSVSSLDCDEVDSSEFRHVNGDTHGGSACSLEGNEKPRGIRDAGLEHLPSFSSRQCLPHAIQDNHEPPRIVHRLKDRWFSKLRSANCMMSMSVKDDNMGSDSQDQVTRIQRVRVRQYRRRLKEISALFMGQDFQAHKGSILTMKFSHDGQYLASAGEDKIVRVWQVVEDERSDADIPDADPSCVYFSVNHLSKLGPLMVEKDGINKSKSLRKTSDSACIIFPPKVFRIFEKPLHEFQGHDGEILDLSWSKNNCLLSSSVDKTVRMWRVGEDQCLKVFSHSDYVTCIQFNPVNDDYFISGSIDGKVRIWAVDCCQVVNWTETRDIITAISYQPDGQGGIIGYLSGTCRFFNISGNHFQLEPQMYLTNKKKSPCKRITSFQFLPQDPNKVLVTSADSQVRIIHGMNVIKKYKGLRNAGNYTSASFTSDGKHIISASEDSNVYIWNYAGEGDSLPSPPKAIRSFECFFSDASVAIPWSGLISNSTESNKAHDSCIKSMPFTSSTSFDLGQEFFLDSSSKGSASATWPEEKLPVSSTLSSISLMSRSQYKLFKTSFQGSSNAHSWGLVIVTAGWDGRIRSFHNYGLPVPL